MSYLSASEVMIDDEVLYQVYLYLYLYYDGCVVLHVAAEAVTELEV